MIRLTGIGHVLLRVSDVERAKTFYSTVLGLEVTEEDPEHGGVFMALEGHAHSLDLFPASDQDDAQPRAPGSLGLGHVAFRVSSEEALRDAYFGLEEHGVKVTGCTVHFVDEYLDAGPIIAQEAVRVLDDDRPETLHQRIHAAEYELYPRCIAAIARGEVIIEGRRVFCRHEKSPATIESVNH